MAEYKKQQSQKKSAAIPATDQASAKTQTPAVKKSAPAPRILFSKENYTWMIIGGVIVLLGMLLMSGGRNTDPAKFDPNLVYSTTRITIAPILIIGGLMVEIYAIFRKPKQSTNA
ncbi:MAG TPA: DUF3098 domain-containing protein [Parafilimonas sp.]|nr:DUF3098 domain-containing protein [Parafilimonas sp.]